MLQSVYSSVKIDIAHGVLLRRDVEHEEHHTHVREYVLALRCECFVQKALLAMGYVKWAVQTLRNPKCSARDCRGTALAPGRHHVLMKDTITWFPRSKGYRLPITALRPSLQ